MTIYWKAVDQYFTVVLFVFQFYPVCNLLEHLSLWDLALSRVNGLKMTLLQLYPDIYPPSSLNNNKLKTSTDFSCIFLISIYHTSEQYLFSLEVNSMEHCHLQAIGDGLLGIHLHGT